MNRWLQVQQVRRMQLLSLAMGRFGSGALPGEHSQSLPSHQLAPGQLAGRVTCGNQSGGRSRWSGGGGGGEELQPGSKGQWGGLVLGFHFIGKGQKVLEC